MATTPLVPRLMLYGPAKIGKTACALAAAHSGEIIAASGAIDPLDTFLGIPLASVKYHETETIDGILKVLPGIVKRKPRTILVDDLSLAVDRSVKNGKIDWRMLDRQLNELGELMTEAKTNGTVFMLTAHEQIERTSSGKPVRGGPKLPGQAPEKFSGSIDCVLRAVNDETMKPWPFVFWSRSRGTWIAGDRLSVFPDCGPMNIAEGLRARGIDIPAPTAAPWMANATASWAAAIKAEGIDNYRTVLKKVTEKFSGKYDPRHLRWAATDALHRVVYESRRENPLAWLDEPDLGTL